MGIEEVGSTEAEGAGLKGSVPNEEAGIKGAVFLAALVANCFLGAFPPVDLRAVSLERAILLDQDSGFRFCLKLQIHL